MIEEMIFIDIIIDWQEMEAERHGKNDAFLLIARHENRHGIFLGPELHDRMTQRVQEFIDTESKRSTSNVKSIRQGISHYPAPQAWQKEAQTNGNTNFVTRAFSFINQRSSWL